MTPDQITFLISALLRRGWTIEKEIIYAPHKTMQLNTAQPWLHDVTDFRDRMASRYTRTDDVTKEDTGTLLESLDVLVDDGGLVEFFDEISEDIYWFANNKKLRVTRYPHGYPSWVLTGTSSLGEDVLISVLKVGRDQFKLEHKPIRTSQYWGQQTSLVFNPQDISLLRRNLTILWDSITLPS